MKREKVTDAQGRRWVSGNLDPDAYFAEVRRSARATAVRSVADRLARAAGSPPQALSASR